MCSNYWVRILFSLHGNAYIMILKGGRDWLINLESKRSSVKQCVAILQNHIKTDHIGLSVQATCIFVAWQKICNCFLMGSPAGLLQPYGELLNSSLRLLNAVCFLVFVVSKAALLLWTIL